MNQLLTDNYKAGLINQTPTQDESITHG